MDKDRLKRELDRLDELKKLYDFIKHGDSYKIGIHRYCAFAGRWDFYNKSLNVNREVLLEVVKSLVDYYENDIDKVLGGSDEH